MRFLNQDASAAETKAFFLGEVNQDNLRLHFPSVPEEFWQSLRGREGTLRAGDYTLIMRVSGPHRAGQGSLKESPLLYFHGIPVVSNRKEALIHWDDLDRLLALNGQGKFLEGIIFGGGPYWAGDASVQACCKLMEKRLPHIKIAKISVQGVGSEGKLEQLIRSLPPGLPNLMVQNIVLSGGAPSLQFFEAIPLALPNLKNLVLWGEFYGVTASHLIQSLAHLEHLELGGNPAVNTGVGVFIETGFEAEETSIHQLGAVVASHPSLKTCCFRRICILRQERTVTAPNTPFTLDKATQDSVLARLYINRARTMLVAQSSLPSQADKKEGKLDELGNGKKNMKQQELFVEALVASRHNIGALDYLLASDPALFARAGLDGAKKSSEFRRRHWKTSESIQQYAAKLAEEDKLEKKERARVFPNQTTTTLTGPTTRSNQE